MVKAAIQGLTSVGFLVERHWIITYKKDEEIKKVVRAYCVADQRAWKEIISRYYYAEIDEEETIEIPEMLRSSKFTVCEEASHPSQA